MTLVDHTKTTQTRTVAIALREDGILHIRALPGTEQGSSDVAENLDVCRQVLGGKKAPILVDIRRSPILDRQGRQAYAIQTNFALAQAILVDSAFSRIAGNLFVRVAHPKHPTRLFTSEDEAVLWLREFLP